MTRPILKCYKNTSVFRLLSPCVTVHRSPLILHEIEDICTILQRVRIARNARAVIATAFLSVCLSIRPSVTFQCFVQNEMNEDMIMRFSLSGSKIILVSEEVKIMRKFASEGVLIKVRSSTVASENLTNKE